MGWGLWIGLSAWLMCMNLVNAVPYSKYGRTCKDIGCRSNEACVMETDACNLSDKPCAYPTCKRTDGSGGLSCTAKVCSSGQYCKTINGNPTCVNTRRDFENDGSDNTDVLHRTDAGTVNSAGTVGSPTSIPSSTGYSSNSGYPYGNAGKTSSTYDSAGYPYNPIQYPQGEKTYDGYSQNGYYQNTYPQSQYPSGQYPQGGGYQGNNNPQYPPRGYAQNIPKPKKPSIGEQITNFAKNLAQRVITQTIIDKVSGRN